MRSFRCSRTWSLISGFALIGLIACATRQRVPSLQTPIEGSLDLRLRDNPRLPGRPDQPDEAHRYYLTKRLGPDGTPADLARQYRLAVDRMERMPRYSTRARRFLPSLEDARRLKGSRQFLQQNLLTTWTALGPGNIGGRTRVLQIHPSKPEVMVSGGVSGGIWKTEDGGQSWRAVADLLPNIAVNSLAMDPSNPDVLYAGTGEGYFRELVRGTGLPLRGEGIFKSEDGGDSWILLESTANPDFHWVNDLIVSRHDSRRVYAATRTGVWRSQDSGHSWARILAAENITGGCLDLAVRTDASTDYLFASCGTFEQAAVYRSIQPEADSPWEVVLTEPGMGRTSLAIAPSRQDTLYALSASYLPGPAGRFEGGLHAVFRSDQGGAAGTWRTTVRNTSPGKLNTLLLANPLTANYRLCGLAENDSYSNMGWYANVIAVDPTNPEIVWAGGVDLFRSDDGGISWGPVSHWAESPPSAHADQHVVVFHPEYDGSTNRTMFLGGDGGLWRTDNALAARSLAAASPCSSSYSQVKWTSLNHGFGVTQFYHGVPFPDGRSYLGGTQDNGTILGSDTLGPDGWIHILGGDGGYVAVDFSDPRIVYAETQYFYLRKSTDGGRTFASATNGVTEPHSNFLFIPPFVMDPNDPKRLWAGGRSIWRTSDGAALWQQAGQKLSNTAMVSAIAVAPSDSDRVLVGRNDGFIHRQDQARTSTGDSVWPSVLPRAGFVTWLAFDPADASIAYAAYAEFGGQHVWKSADGGRTWEPIDGIGQASLPDIPVHAIAIDPNHPEHLYVATDLGVFTSRTGGQEWAVENTGFSNAVTESLCLHTRPGAEPELYAFTHGRGAWRVPLASDAIPPPCSPERWIAHVTPAGVAYTTTILATNLGKDTAQADLVAYDEDGTYRATAGLRAGPGETVSHRAELLFSGKPVSHFGICGPLSMPVTAVYRSTDEAAVSAHVPESSARGRSFLLYPAEWDVVFEGIAVVNLGANPSRIEAASLDAQGKESQRIALHPGLAPRAKHVALLSNLLSDFRGAAVRIESSEPATLLVLRGTHGGTRPAVLYQTQPVTRGEDGPGPVGPCTPERWVLHVTPADSGFDTTVFTTNLGASDALLELLPYLADGSRLNSVLLRILAGHSLISRSVELFSGQPASHFGVCAPPSTQVTSAYRSLWGASASAHALQTSALSRQFLFYPGDWESVYDGAAIINRGAEAARVQAVLLNAAGAEAGASL